MDGDECPLKELVNLSKEFNAKIILDEAHSTGIIGESGNGLAIAKQLENEIAIRIYTFGKAMGIHGACVVGSKTITNYIVNAARPFIYTTALPLHSIAAIDSAFLYLKNNIILQQILNNKISLFKQHCKIDTNSNSPIQPILFSNHDLTKDMAKLLTNEKFDVRPILSPTVRVGTERLRICLHAYNEDEDIIRLAQTLNKVYIDHSA
jgi:8-amino-7-oxononanoate synthase